MDPDEISRSLVVDGDSRDERSLGSLDLRGVNARLVYHDGEPTMVVSDGDSEIEFSSGLGGAWYDAVKGAHELAAVALSLADELRAHPPTQARRAGPPG